MLGKLESSNSTFCQTVGTRQDSSQGDRTSRKIVVGNTQDDVFDGRVDHLNLVIRFVTKRVGQPFLTGRVATLLEEVRRLA